jgi:hypothetical protein
LTLLKTRTYTHVVTRHVSIAALLLVAAALLSPAAAHAQAVPRSMYVSALDETGAPVADLGPSDFLVREDKATREVLRVAAADEPMQLAVLVDNSQAARNYIGDIRSGLDGFVAEMTNGMKNELSLTALAERPTVLASPSTDRDQIMKGVYRIFEQRQSGSYLLDAPSRSTEFSAAPRRRSSSSRPRPQFSSRRYEDVLKPLHEVGAAARARARPAVQQHDEMPETAPPAVKARRPRPPRSWRLRCPGALKKLATG